MLVSESRPPSREPKICGGVWSLDESLSVEYKPCPPTMGAKSPCDLKKHPAVICEVLTSFDRNSNVVTSVERPSDYTNNTV